MRRPSQGKTAQVPRRRPALDVRCSAGRRLPTQVPLEETKDLSSSRKSWDRVNDAAPGLHELRTMKQHLEGSPPVCRTVTPSLQWITRRFTAVPGSASHMRRLFA